MTGKTVLITGGSSGIGLECAREMVRRGYKVWELSRREMNEPGVNHISCDAADYDAVRAAAERAEADGGIDILICCAGFGISGAVEFTDPADARRQLDVNLFGTVNAVTAAVPGMRRRGRGRIVCVSSVAGEIPIPFQTYYSVSKAAVDAFVRATAGELRPFGVTLCAVLPGDARTGFTDARRKSAAGDDVYGGRIERSVAGMEKDERGGMSAAAVARRICAVAEKKRPKPLTGIGAGYRVLLTISKILPCRLVDFIVYLMYGR